MLEINFEKWGLSKLLSEGPENNQSEQVDEPPKKLNPTELLKQQLRETTGSRSNGGSAVFRETASAFEEETRKYEANDKDAPEDADQLQWWHHQASEYPR